jgi:hypothetical protein
MPPCLYFETSNACGLEMFMVYPQTKFHKISTHVSVVAAMKLKDKCGFHFAIVLLLPSKERIMLRI